MRLVLQRVEAAKVCRGEETVAEIGKGLVAYVGISQDENSDSIDWLIAQVRERLSDDGQLLLLSQFTLFAKFKTNKPSFHTAERPAPASDYFDTACQRVSSSFPDRVRRGVFGSYLHIHLTGLSMRSEYMETD